jgi:hypothetical protein
LSFQSSPRNAPRDLRIRLGEWDVNRESEFYPHIERDVISVIIHPEYYPGNLYNDIAVIKFEGAVDYGYRYIYLTHTQFHLILSNPNYNF